MERIKAKKNGFGKRNRNRLIFYCAFLSLPVLQFCIFYIGVNFNSILLAFKSYEYETGAYQWVGFMNFKEVFRDFGSVLYLQASIRNSLMLYAFIRTESNFNPKADSDAGARGLMQITEVTFDWIKTKIAPTEDLTFENLYDPETNIRFGSYFVSYCLLRYQDDPAFAAYCAWNVRLWTALIPGLIFLWLVSLRTPLFLAFSGGMIHAVSVAAIARATGQDIVRGDLCIPLILLSMVLVQSYYGNPRRWKLPLLFVAVFGCFTAWDLSQLLFAGWAGFEILRVLCGGVPVRKRRTVWIVIALAIALNALFVPFNVTYGLIMSPFFCILLPLLMVMLWSRGGRDDGRGMPFRKRILLFVVALGCLWGFHALFVDNPGYRANYSHFSETMKAKWKFKNVKPVDPSKLSYDARMMWTPSMHSATWEIAVSFFPSLGSLPFLSSKDAPSLLRQIWNYAPVTLSVLLLMLLAGGLFTPVRTALLRDLPRSALPDLFLLGFLIGFVYIVRYHEAGCVCDRVSGAGAAAFGAGGAACAEDRVSAAAQNGLRFPNPSGVPDRVFDSCGAVCGARRTEEVVQRGHLSAEDLRADRLVPARGYARTNRCRQLHGRSDADGVLRNESGAPAAVRNGADPPSSGGVFEDSLSRRRADAERVLFPLRGEISAVRPGNARAAASVFECVYCERGSYLASFSGVPDAL